MQGVVIIQGGNNSWISVDGSSRPEGREGDVLRTKQLRPRKQLVWIDAEPYCIRGVSIVVSGKGIHFIVLAIPACDSSVLEKVAMHNNYDIVPNLSTE